ncbi:MAG: hypothetical protein ACI9K9_002262, partial [Neolewinella sp.]
KEHFLPADAFTKTKQERAEDAKRLEQKALWKRLEKLKEEERLRDAN